MHPRALAVGGLIMCALALGTASAQAPNARSVKLVGDRFKPLTYEEMTPPHTLVLPEEGCTLLQSRSLGPDDRVPAAIIKSPILDQADR